MSDAAEAAIGKSYDGGSWEVRADAFRAYASATDDDNPAYLGEEAVAPPMFHVQPSIGLMMQMASDPQLDIDIRFLVHGEHAMHFHQPLTPGDQLVLSGALKSMEVKSSGRVFTFTITGTVADDVALQGVTTYFVRNPPDPDAVRKPRPPAPAEPPPPNWNRVQRVTEDQARRYAEASSDRNPIHIDPEAAKAAGLPGCILHGLCTMALAARDLVNRYGDADPRRLKFLSVRWARPVFPGTTLELEVWEQGVGDLRFRTLGPDGKPVLVHGIAQLEAP